MAISGHRSEQSLLHYNTKPSTSQLLHWHQRLSFDIIFFLFGNLRREALIEAPSRDGKESFQRSQRFVSIKKQKSGLCRKICQ